MGRAGGFGRVEVGDKDILAEAAFVVAAEVAAAFGA